MGPERIKLRAKSDATRFAAQTCLTDRRQPVISPSVSSKTALGANPVVLLYTAYISGVWKIGVFGREWQKSPQADEETSVTIATPTSQVISARSLAERPNRDLRSQTTRRNVLRASLGFRPQSEGSNWLRPKEWSAKRLRRLPFRRAFPPRLRRCGTARGVFGGPDESRPKRRFPSWLRRRWTGLASCVFRAHRRESRRPATKRACR